MKNNPTQATSVRLVGGALTDGSGTITTGGTAQNALAQNVERAYLLIQNLDTSEDLWVNVAANAAVDTAGSIKIKPDTAWEPDFIPIGRISVVAATTGHKFTIKEG